MVKVDYCKYLESIETVYRIVDVFMMLSNAQPSKSLRIVKTTWQIKDL